MTIRIYFLIFALFSAVFFTGMTTQSAKAHESGEEHTHSHKKDISKTQIRRQTRDWRSGKLQEDIEEKHKSLMKKLIPETPRDSTTEDNAAQDSNKKLIYRDQNKSDAGKRLWNSY